MQLISISLLSVYINQFISFAEPLITDSLRLLNVNFEYVYGGFIPLSRSTLPFFANVGKNVYSGAAGDGAGVTRASMCGTFLADWVYGRDSEELRYMQQ